jgi:hypothetical protein
LSPRSLSAIASCGETPATDVPDRVPNIVKVNNHPSPSR